MYCTGRHHEVDIQENKEHPVPMLRRSFFLVREMVINRLCPAGASGGRAGRWLRVCEQLMGTGNHVHFREKMRLNRQANR